MLPGVSIPRQCMSISGHRIAGRRLAANGQPQRSCGWPSLVYGSSVLVCRSLDGPLRLSVVYDRNARRAPSWATTLWQRHDGAAQPHWPPVPFVAKGICMQGLAAARTTAVDADETDPTLVPRRMAPIIYISS